MSLGAHTLVGYTVDNLNFLHITTITILDTIGFYNAEGSWTRSHTVLVVVDDGAIGAVLAGEIYFHINCNVGKIELKERIVGVQVQKGISCHIRVSQAHSESLLSCNLKSIDSAEDHPGIGETWESVLVSINDIEIFRSEVVHLSESPPTENDIGI